MGLDNSLILATSLRPLQALHLLVGKFGLSWCDETHLSGPAIWVAAIDVHPRSKSLYEEAFQFTPDVSVAFRLDTNDEAYEEGVRVMLRATMLLLMHGQDGVLLFNGEHIILQRLKGCLVLNTDTRDWRDERRLEDEITLPHEIRPLPSPLL